MAEVDNAEAMLKLITKDNVIYVLEAYPNLIQDIVNVDSFGYGFDKDEILTYVLQPLAKKLGKDDAWVNKTMQGSIEEISSTAKSEATTARMKEDNIVTTYYKEEDKYDNAIEAQRCFDKANALLVEVANMNPKPTIVKENNSAKITLPDGRFIEVEFDENGEITRIGISYDTAPESNGEDWEEVQYEKNEAYYDIDKSNENWEGAITSGYDFEKLKAFVEQIFS